MFLQLSSTHVYCFQLFRRVSVSSSISTRNTSKSETACNPSYLILWCASILGIYSIYVGHEKFGFLVHCSILSTHFYLSLFFLFFVCYSYFSTCFKQKSNFLFKTNKEFENIFQIQYMSYSLPFSSHAKGFQNIRFLTIMLAIVRFFYCIKKILPANEKFPPKRFQAMNDLILEFLSKIWKSFK